MAKLKRFIVSEETPLEDNKTKVKLTLILTHNDNWVPVDENAPALTTPIYQGEPDFSEELISISSNTLSKTEVDEQRKNEIETYIETLNKTI